MAHAVGDGWERDRHGAARLDYSRQFSALFHIADAVCPGLAVEEYISFLDALAFRVRAKKFSPAPGASDRGLGRVILSRRTPRRR